MQIFIKEQNSKNGGWGTDPAQYPVPTRSGFDTYRLSHLSSETYNSGYVSASKLQNADFVVVLHADQLL